MKPASPVLVFGPPVSELPVIKQVTVTGVRRKRESHLHLEEIRQRNDFDALVLTKLEQMLVSTHQIIRIARGRTFEDAVVSRVFFDGVYSLLWFDVLCETANLPDCLIDLLVWPAKLVAPQNSLDFIQDRIRDSKMDGTIFRHLKDVPGIA